ELLATERLQDARLSEDIYGTSHAKPREPFPADTVRFLLIDDRDARMLDGIGDCGSLAVIQGRRCAAHNQRLKMLCSRIVERHHGDEPGCDQRLQPLRIVAAPTTS